VLMAQTIQTAGECKAAKITLEVKVTNTSAIGLYMKNGFIPTGIKPCYYHDGSDAIYMQRLI
ncbi:ribosomal-protein-alanine N-acetyltransferase, partial [Bacteroides ovatus]